MPDTTWASLAIRMAQTDPTGGVITLMLGLGLLLILAYAVSNLLKNTRVTEALAKRLETTHIDGIDTIKSDVKTVLERQSGVITRLETLEDASMRQDATLATVVTEIESLKRASCSNTGCPNRTVGHGEQDPKGT